MRFGSVCSGIEAASAAWELLGWLSVFFSEIEQVPCSVLAHHYPKTPNLGDMTKFKEWPDANIDVLVGGTPCQSFSVAGLRKGLDDPRGNLMLTFGAIAAKYRPKWLVWENVPGVLSSNGGRDFGTFLGMLAELGYGFAYRVLDAQFFGVAQRRRRVFVVAYLGDWRPAAAVLFERHSLSGDIAPRREAWKETSSVITKSIAGSLDTECGGGKMTHQTVNNGHIIGTITARMFNSLGARDVEEGAILPVITQPVALRGREGGATAELGGPVANCLRASGGGGDKPYVMAMQPDMQVRRLTPVECERLQGFPDNYTQVPHRGRPAADGPRYKALGNSMAVPVMAWIGKRIQEVDLILKERAA
jgi:DNA (cytosine-5)-methyltransferase 1